MFRLEDVLAGTNGRLIAGPGGQPFRGASLDSRTIQPGELFIALRGDRLDGHAFVEDALARGAGGALVQHVAEGEPWGSPDWSGPPIVLVDDTSEALPRMAAHWRRRHPVRVVGVTGSVGKTTAKEVIASLLAERFSVLRSPANLNTELGLSLALLNLEPSHEIAVLEMAMYDMGEIERLARIAQPEVGVVLNVAPTHLERLRTIERIAQAKAELVEALPAEGHAILNADDERVRAMRTRTAAPTVLYGTTPAADLRAEGICSRGLDGTEATLRWNGREARVRLRLLGAHSVYPALSAVAVALHFGIEFGEAVEGLTQVEPGPRLRIRSGQRGSTLIDDTYNASPASTIAALDLLAEMDGRRVAILGDMLELGSWEDEGHQIVGRRAAQVAHWLVVVGKRGRMIGSEAIARGMDPTAVDFLETARDAARRVGSRLRPGDYVLVKGSRAMGMDVIAEALAG